METRPPSSTFMLSIKPAATVPNSWALSRRQFFKKPPLLLRELALHFTDDGRVLFAIPWGGRLLVGTTETETTLSDELIVTKEEAELLHRHLNRYFARPFQMTEIVSAIAGLRPLVSSRSSRDTKKLIRDYEIEIGPESGLINVLGGKWTVYRAMAEEAIDVLKKSLTDRITDGRTRDYLLFGAEDDGTNAELLHAAYGVPRSTIRHLTEKFGSGRRRVLDLLHEDSSLRAALVDGSPHIQAEVVYCAREEMAVSIGDILSRRLGLQFYDWRLAIQAAPVVGHILGRELRWSSDRTQEEIERYIAGINMSMEALGVEPVRAIGAHKGKGNGELHRRA
jgi:glycerol-3-phosphate dehydrogenase